MQVAAAERTGQVVGGKYRILRFVAAGGMGDVFEAEHRGLGRRFALKFLHPALAGDRGSLARFEREARAAGGIRSEHVVAPVDFGVSPDGSAYLAMEFLDGESLRELLDRGTPIPVGRAADLVVQACLGVQAAHDLGIVHRDLNPRNIHVCTRADGTDWVKILDFGIAKIDDSALEETATGAMLGTPAYVAPEQARGEKGIDHRADVYALGCILFEMLTGARPHPGDTRNAILHHVCTQPPLSLAMLRPDLPSDLVAIVQRALSSDPAGRPQSVAELARLVEPFRERKVWPRIQREEATPFASPGKTPSATKHPLVSKGWLLGAGIAGIAAVAAFVILRDEPSKARLPLPADLRLFVPAPNPDSVQQIAALSRANESGNVAAIASLQATPRGIWLTLGTPEEVRTQVARAITLAGKDRSVPVFVPYNRPFRDCAGGSAGGVGSVDDYHAWIEGVAKGIGNERAIVILEPDALGIIPYNTGLDGKEEWCKPMVTDGSGQLVRAPGAGPSEVYRLIRDAVATLRKLSPNAWVYMDATHSQWLSVGEVAYRMTRVGLQGIQGGALNVSNFQPTWQGVYFGHWISACLHYAAGKGEAAFRECPRQPGAQAPEAEWKKMDGWYRERAPGMEADGLRFVIDTSRNGRGVLDVSVYGSPPFNQPTEVVAKLGETSWCNPPGAGTGEKPSTKTGVPLLDAYLWVKCPGESDGPCDMAGNTRSWDFEQYNPWGIVGDARQRFDPLWGTIDPAAGVWFPEQALDLAANGLK